MLLITTIPIKEIVKIEHMSKRQIFSKILKPEAMDTRILQIKSIIN
jgi:hypothetical protein